MNSAAAVAVATRADDPCAELEWCLDRLSAYDVSELGDARQEKWLKAVTRGEAQLSAFRLRILAEAERSRTAARSGAANTGQWAARVSNTDQVDAQRQVALAQGLEGRITTRQALASGVISSEHAAVIVRADRDLPSHLSATQRDVVEAALVQKAQTLSPSALRRAARRALEAVETDPALVDAHEDHLVTSEEDRARAKTTLTLHDNGNGTITGRFTVPVAQGELLRKILQTITAPRRGRLGASGAQVGEQAARADWDRARGEAFIELLEHLPTDHLHPKTAATLVVTVEEATMRGALKVAGLDTGGVVSAGEARRLACNASLMPAVLNGQSLVLDLGRSARLFSQPQRTATGLRHQTCAADGCERPFAWCELHHRNPWSRGGSTDLTDAVPLCHFHHQRIHDRHYVHARSPGGSITFHRRT